MEVVDLSRTLGYDDMRIDGHPPYAYELFHTHEEHGRTNATISFSVHQGTHIDPPYHFREDGETIDEMPAAGFIAEGAVIRLGAVAPGHEISSSEAIAGAPDVSLEGRIVLLDSEWWRVEDPETYYKRGPYLGVDLAEWLVSQRVRAVGLANPPDRRNPPPRKGDAPVHRTLLGAGVYLIENLVHLDRLGRRPFSVIAMPIKIHRGCGGPARVVAVEDWLPR